GWLLRRLFRCLGRRLLALLATNGSLGARHIAILVEEVDVVGVLVHAGVGDLLRLALCLPGLLARNLPDGAVLDVVHEILLTRYSELRHLFSHVDLRFGFPPRSSCRASVGKLLAMLPPPSSLSIDFAKGPQRLDGGSANPTRGV